MENKTGLDAILMNANPQKANRPATNILRQFPPSPGPMLAERMYIYSVTT